MLMLLYGFLLTGKVASRVLCSHADPVEDLGLRLQCDHLALVWFSRCSLSVPTALAKVRQFANICVLYLQFVLQISFLQICTDFFNLFFVMKFVL